VRGGVGRGDYRRYEARNSIWPGGRLNRDGPERKAGAEESSGEAKGQSVNG
jgi:hypothetical protein